MSRQYDNRGRDQFNFEQVQGNVLIQNQPTRSRNELVLLQAIEQEVNSRLVDSLHNHVFVTLDKESHPEQVKRLWDTEIKIGAKPATVIPPETNMLEVFDQPEIAGRLLILGAPGAGKTTTMLDLAKSLVNKAKQDSNQPIPVLLNLSSWIDPRQLTQDWLIEEIKSKYGVRKDIAKEWLQEQLILPMLDGLDEVKPEHQESCVAAINLWLEGDLRPISVVVCSRQEEYANYQAQLNLNGAILLRSLINEQIQEYLSGVNRTELWQLLYQDTELLELVRTPLLLSITILSYEKLSLQEWQTLNSTRQRVKLLLDAYVQTMFERKLNSKAYRNRSIPSEKQTRQWLRVLSLKMQRESQTEFLIEKMQPSVWLSGKQEGLYKLIFGLILGLMGGLSLGGEACIEHLSLRLILYHNREIPWNYARFLNYSTKLLFLQRVGGRYRFIHKLLQEHFAEM